MRQSIPRFRQCHIGGLLLHSARVTLRCERERQKSSEEEEKKEAAAAAAQQKRESITVTASPSPLPLPSLRPPHTVQGACRARGCVTTLSSLPQPQSENRPLLSSKQDLVREPNWELATKRHLSTLRMNGKRVKQKEVRQATAWQKKKRRRRAGQVFSSPCGGHTHLRLINCSLLLPSAAANGLFFSYFMAAAVHGRMRQLSRHLFPSSAHTLRIHGEPPFQQQGRRLQSRNSLSGVTASPSRNCRIM